MEQVSVAPASGSETDGVPPTLVSSVVETDRSSATGGWLGVPLGKRLYRRWSFVEFALPTLSLVVAWKSASRTSAGVAVGCVWRYSAATPTVCGVPIEVPLFVVVAVVLPIPSETMFTPGANQSTHEP